jgi:3-isopropylmalate/(R)-2-methylmalate dehydratase large subunit
MAGAMGSFACGIGPTEMASVFALGECWFKVPQTIRVDITGSYGFPVMSKDLILHLLGELTTRGAIYKSVEFGGPGLASMPMYQRLTITNMTTELGAKAGMIEPDELTLDYLESLPEIKNGREGEVYEHADLASDPGAEFERTMHVDLDELEPLVARPQSPDNVYPVRTTDTGPVDQVFVGSCTNARLEDLRVVASILEGEEIADGTRLLVYPASQRIYREAMHEGIADVIMEAGGVFNASSCGACFGGMGGVLDEGEVCVSTSNRNFPGRMGHVESLSYLVSPATAAVTALAGELVDPTDYLSSTRWNHVAKQSEQGLKAMA